jgi:outer membrane protein OmpA-like peptidoglycan-associated protein
MQMKKFFFIYMLLCVFGLTQISAQNPNYKTGVSFKKLFMDYQSQNGGNITDFTSYNSGFEIGFHKTLQERLNLVVPFKMGVVSLPESEFGHKRILGLDAQIQYQIYKPDARVIPYVFAGLGGVSESTGSVFSSDAEFNLQAPIGVGINFKLADRAFINWQSEFRKSFSDNRDNLHHGIGFVYLFGKKMMTDTIVEIQEETKLDSDGDGLIDEVDLCPQAKGPKELNGCPDSDGDGVADYEDKCPDFLGLKEFEGCPDTDGDGISDIEDECPNMAGDKLNNGCPSNDRDGDGVPDNLDNCPDIPGVPAKRGCPGGDKDKDGIADDIDQCPDLPGSVATKGCPDTDGDGVSDAEDSCPNDAGLKIYRGCPDTDGDGIEDSRDRCPNTAGPVANNGCPEIAQEDREILDLAMRAVQFDTGRATLKSESYSILNKIGDIMARYSNYNLSISGHTDNTGSAAANQRLSESRAKACYDYLATQGVSTSRMNYAGYGESRPIADNNTLRGRSLNRRTEFNLIPR